MQVNTVGLFPHVGRALALDLAAKVAAGFALAGIEVLASKSAAELLADAGVEAASAGKLAARCDLAVSVGGDGAFLRAFQQLPHVPLVGVNCGEIGYLAEVEPADIDALVAAAADGRLRTVTRIVLEVETAARDAAPGPHPALNDVVLSKGPGGRAIKVDVRTDGIPFLTTLADGIVLSTPIGSTAYSFSAGGPLLAPDLDAFLVTPVASHSLWDRTLVLAAQSRVDVDLIGDRPANLTVDGVHIADLAPGESIRVGARDERARIVRWDNTSFSERLRRKVGLDRRRSP
jgi:NAD+ kinase